MTMFRLTAAALAALAACAPLAHAGEKIDLRTAKGVEAVKGQWRYSEVKIVEVDGSEADGTPRKTYDIQPHAQATDYDDSGWQVLDPTTLGKGRGGGKVCFCWYRIKVTLPEGVEGKKVAFQTVVDDYGEVWVDGKCPYRVGQTGGAIVAGFNTPNRVELPDPKPGKTYSIAVFGINGPISVTPGNRIFLGPTFLELGQ